MAANFIDANVIIHYFIREPEHLHKRAVRIVEAEEDLTMSDVALSEAAYTLSTFYQVPRPEIVDKLIEFIGKSNLSVFSIDKGLVINALLLCKPSRRISFGDALIWSAARSAGSPAIYSLDEKFPSDGLEVRRG